MYTDMVIIAGLETDLLTSLPADDSPAVHAVPEVVSLAEEGGELMEPVFPQGPREYLILLLILVLFHVVGQVTTGAGE